MKKTLFFVAIAAASLLTACNKDPQGPKPITEIYFTQVGFAQEHNSILDKDYIFKDVNTTSNIDVTLPNSFNPNDLKALAISFTTNKDAISVTLEDETVLKGVDTLDFSKPVEIRLTDGEKFFAYTVTVGVAKSENWGQIACTAVGDTLYSTPAVAYDKAGDQHYIFNMWRHKDETTDYPVLYSLSADDNLSAAKVLNENQATGDFAVAVNGSDVYVVYGDNGDGSSAQKKLLTVGKVSGGNFSVVGNRCTLYKCATVDKPALMPIAANNIWVAYQNSANVSGVLNKRLMNLCNYDGSAWTQANTIADRPASSYGYVNRTSSSDGYYLATFNQNTVSYSLYKNSGSGWSTMFESKKPADAAGAEAASCGVFAFNITSGGDIYFISNIQIDTKVFKLALQKYDKAADKFVMVGSPIEGIISTGGSIYPNFAVAEDGTVYLAFQHPNEVCRPMVATMDPATKEWSAPEALSSEECDDEPKLTIDKNGKVRVFVKFNGSGKIAVFSPLDKRK